MNGAPVIGLPCYHVPVGAMHIPIHAQGPSYVRAVLAAGGAPVLVPLDMGSDVLLAVYARLDGLLLTGGEDVVPVEYGQEATPQLGRVDAERDRTELILARQALADSMPILGICRGIQVMNVAAGGTLIQDIPTQVANAINHRTMDSSEPRTPPGHEISTLRDSRLAGVLGATRIGVNSSHHQAVDRTAPGFRAVAHAPDGVIEAIESERGFALGVQCHPEQLVGHADWAGALFQAFTAAARKCAPAFLVRRTHQQAKGGSEETTCPS